MKGTLYTEKVERLGIHTPHAFESDIFQELFVKEVLKKENNVLLAANTIAEIKEWIIKNEVDEVNEAFAVVDENGELSGVVKWIDIFSKQADKKAPLSSLISKELVYVYPDEQLSQAVELMGRCQTAIVAVISHGEGKKLIGVLTYKNILEVYLRRRKVDEIYNQTISLKPMIHRLFLWAKQVLTSRK
ncbi:MAG: CBS domain-containing protein [Chitinophagaceae bacterium]